MCELITIFNFVEQYQVTLYYKLNTFTITYIHSLLFSIILLQITLNEPLVTAPNFGHGLQIRKE